MQSLCDFFFGTSGHYCCVDGQHRPTFHGLEQRYVSPTTGKCKPLVVQAVYPKCQNIYRTEIPVGANVPKARKLAVWLVLHPPFDLRHILVWFPRWAWFTLTLIWPFNVPTYTGFYPSYLSRYHGQLWAARSPHEYSLRTAKLGSEPAYEITHGTHPRRLIIFDPASRCWYVCSDPQIIKQQRYVAISYRYSDVVPYSSCLADRQSLEKAFITKIENTLESLRETAYWLDLSLVDVTGPSEEINHDLYRMADVYRSAQFTLIMFSPPAHITEEQAWLSYGERLWTLPEALLSRELRYKFRDGEVMFITLHQLANRAYPHAAEESAIVNSYGLREPLERLERLSLLKNAIWRRTSNRLQCLQEDSNSVQLFRADRVYALMGFFEHRIHPHARETELQAFVRLSMANDNDGLVERMVSLLPCQIPGTTSWYAEQDEWGVNLWNIEPTIQVVGLTEDHALVLAGCRAAAIRWKDFPSVAFATPPSMKRVIANYLPNLSWEILFIGIFFEMDGVHTPLVIAVVLMLLAPLLVAFGSSGRMVHPQPWLVGVKGLISAEEASDFMYGGAAFFLPRTFYSASGTPLSRTDRGRFRDGDPKQLDALKPQTGVMEDDALYTLIDTLSATIYYFRAAHPPTVCLYVGRESGMGRFVLCSERCTINQLHKETVVRMPWHISQHMRTCDWVALG